MLLGAAIPFTWYIYESSFGPGTAGPKGLILVLVVGAAVAGVGVIGATALSARRSWRRRRDEVGGRRVSVFDVLLAPAIAVAAYVGSFATFYALDGTFPFQGRTTLYCHDRAVLNVYLPLFEWARSKGWSGGCPYRFPCSGWENEKPIQDFLNCVKDCPRGGRRAGLRTE